MIHADGFALGTIVDEDGNTDGSKNHRAAIRDSLRIFTFQHGSRMDKKTGQRELPVICRHNYVGPSANDVHRETYTWPKIWHKRSLEFIPTRDWREFNIFTAPEGETERKDVGIIFKCAPLFPTDSILTLE